MKTIDDVILRESTMLLEELEQKIGAVNKKTIAFIKKFSGKDKLWMINYNPQQARTPISERALNSTNLVKGGKVFTCGEWCPMEENGVYENLEILDAFETGNAKEVDVKITIEDVLEELDGYPAKKQAEIYKKVAYDENLRTIIDSELATTKAMGYVFIDFDTQKNFITGVDKDFVWNIYLKTE